MNRTNTTYNNYSYSGNTCAGAYRYGFNGKEKDPENTSGAYDFGARIFDSRIGRWLTVDKLHGQYPHLTPYNFAGNNPVFYIDPDGNVIEPSPAMTESEKVRYDAMIDKVKSRNPELYSYLQTVKIH